MITKLDALLFVKFLKIRFASDKIQKNGGKNSTLNKATLIFDVKI